MTINLSPIRTTYEYERIDDKSYHSVAVIGADNVIIPAPMILGLARDLQDENFAIGVINGRLTFVFRTKQDALQFKTRLRHIEDTDG